MDNCAPDKTKKAYDGICKCNCASQPINYVCGADGLTYRNTCAMICAGVPQGNNCNQKNCNCRG